MARTDAVPERGHHAEPLYLTGARCHQVASVLRKSMRDLGLSLRPEHDLERIVRQVELLAGLGPGDTIQYWRLAAGNEGDAIAAAVLITDQAERIAAALQLATRVRGVRPLAAQWLKRRIDRLRTQDTEALDHLFEIEMAGRLARASALDVAIEEPDIVVSLGGARVVLACKRPRSTATIVGRIRSAREQLAPASGARVVLVSADALFHHEPGSPPPRQYAFESWEAAHDHGEAILESAVTEAREQTEKAFREGVSGVLYHGVLTFWTNAPSAYRSLGLCRRVPNPDDPGSAKLLSELKRIMFDRVR